MRNTSKNSGLTSTYMLFVFMSRFIFNASHEHNTKSFPFSPNRILEYYNDRGLEHDCVHDYNTKWRVVSCTHLFVRPSIQSRTMSVSTKLRQSAKALAHPNDTAALTFSVHCPPKLERNVAVCICANECHTTAYMVFGARQQIPHRSTYVPTLRTFPNDNGACVFWWLFTCLGVSFNTMCLLQKLDGVRVSVVQSCYDQSSLYPLTSSEQWPHSRLASSQNSVRMAASICDCASLCWCESVNVYVCVCSRTCRRRWPITVQSSTLVEIRAFQPPLPPSRWRCADKKRKCYTLPRVPTVSTQQT